jgi:DNA repair exonuclease SbcCD ATPase subunit
MTKFIMVIIIVAAGLVAYNYVTTGEIALIPGSALSEEEQEVKNLTDRFYKARQMVKQAQRSAGVGGVATVSMVDDEMNEIEQIEREIVTLMDSLESDAAFEKAEKLEREIEDFKSGRG